MSSFPRPNRDVSQMVWVRAPISGAKWQVHREVAPLLAHIVSTAEQRGHLFDYGPADVDDDWGYNVRKIAGSGTWSWHSAGVAVDIDAQEYPQGQRRKVPPGWLIELFRQWGWDWGGTWSHADPMHFEATDRDRVARLRAVLYASHATTTPVPVPVGTPSPQHRPPPTAIDHPEDPMFITATGLGLYLMAPGGKFAKFATPARYEAARKSAPTIPTVELTADEARMLGVW